MNFHRSTRTFACDAPFKAGDPTGTMDIRRKYVEQFATRFRKVRNLLKAAVVAQDILGLKAGTVSSFAIAASPGNKEEMFKGWMRNLLNQVVAENDGEWLRPMLQLTYNRAIVRAMRLSKSNVMPHDTVDTVNAMLALCKVEMHGTLDTVVQHCTRAAALGWLHNISPAEAFVDMSVALQAVGIARTRALVETMVVKMFSTATLDQFEAKGITHVGLVPETQPRRRNDGASIYTTDAGGKSYGFKGAGSRSSREAPPSRSTIYRIRNQEKTVEEGSASVNVETAGDDYVCQDCQDIEDDNPYDIDTARSLIPAHVFCRCAFVPDDSTGEGDTGDAATILDYNENHDPKSGEFTSGEGGPGGGSLNKGTPASEVSPFPHEPHRGGRIGTPVEMNKIIDDVTKQLDYNRNYMKLGKTEKFMLNGKECSSAAATNLFFLTTTISDVCPIEQLPGTIAHEAMHAKFENYMRAYHNDKLPPEMMAFHKSIDFDVLKKLDGVSAYSRDYWTSLAKGGKGNKGVGSNLKTAVHETLAEMARIHLEFGKPDLPGGVNSDWKKLYDNVNTFFSTRTNPKGLHHT